MSIPKPVVVAILDGWGEWEVEKGNPIRQADLPTIKHLDDHYPKIYLQASGRGVGLPAEFPGNSEVGHQTLGSGQIVFQFLPLITHEIVNGGFYDNEVLLNAIDWAKKHNSTLHLMGLASDGGVHSHINHLIALLSLAKKREAPRVLIHAFTDGRDTPPQSAERYIRTMIRECEQIGAGQLATMCGRYYAMDRNENWDRLEEAFLAMTEGEGIKSRDPLEVIEAQYQQGITDEYIKPVVFTDDEGKPLGTVEDNDVIVCFNFRKDRSRQLTKAFTTSGFDKFKKAVQPRNIRFVGFAEYEKGLSMEAAFNEQEISTRLGEILSREGKKQFRIAETEKYAHVTYFFNGGVEKPYPGEDRKIIPSKNVPSYDVAPEMSIAEVNEELLLVLEAGKYDFILVNYANPDMVGHTGNFQAGMKAVRAVDRHLNILMDNVLEKGGHLLITSDHGNIEEMVNINSGEKNTSHTNNPVPCWYVTPDNYIQEKIKRQKDEVDIEGMLIDVAPTVLELLGLKKPDGMMGASMLETFSRKRLG
jgi:2,3-bisphosphoglycerate-independent phosphoglycerate mutase